MLYTCNLHNTVQQLYLNLKNNKKNFKKKIKIYTLLLFLISVLEKTLESPLDCKEIQPVHSKGNQSWIFIGRTDAEAETPMLWPPDSKNWLFEKDPAAGKDWKQEEKGTTEYGMVGWHHWLNGHEFKQALGVGDGQGILVCCSHGVTESDMTERLNWTELVVLSIVFNMSFNRQYLKAGSWNHWHVIW